MFRLRHPAFSGCEFTLSGLYVQRSYRGLTLFCQVICTTVRPNTLLTLPDDFRYRLKFHIRTLFPKI